MRIFLLADGKSAHTKNWIVTLLKEGIELYLFSLTEISEEISALASNNQLQMYSASMSSGPNRSTLGKMGYLLTLPILRKELQKFQADVVHAHYISSYGLLAYLTSFRPYVLSVWGSDIIVFPKKSLLHKLSIKKILKSSSAVFSSSKLMLKILQNDYNIKNSIHIPFGVDMETFRPAEKTKDDSGITFIIVKSLLETYGIDIAVKAFVNLLRKHPAEKIRLNIYGDGPLREEYERMANPYLGNQIKFHGKIAHKEVPHKLREADVLLNISRSESFGVSVIEASACGLAVIVSNRGGLPETVLAGKTALVLPVLDEEHCLRAMETYMANKNLVKQHGTSGRKFVLEHYDHRNFVDAQIGAYKHVIENQQF